jgi:hypothetical protein
MSIRAWAIAMTAPIGVASTVDARRAIVLRGSAGGRPDAVWCAAGIAHAATAAIDEDDREGRQ